MEGPRIVRICFYLLIHDTTTFSKKRFAHDSLRATRQGLFLRYCVACHCHASPGLCPRAGTRLGAANAAGGSDGWRVQFWEPVLKEEIPVILLPS